MGEYGVKVGLSNGSCGRRSGWIDNVGGSFVRAVAARGSRPRTRYRHALRFHRGTVRRRTRCWRPGRTLCRFWSGTHYIRTAGGAIGPITLTQALIKYETALTAESLGNDSSITIDEFAAFGVGDLDVAIGDFLTGVAFFG